LNFSSAILLVVKVLGLGLIAIGYAEGSTLGGSNESFEAIDLDENAATDIGDGWNFRV